MRYHQPETLDAALHAAAAGARPLAGGTDYFPALGEGLPDHDILDLSRVSGLRGITRDGTGWRMGATTTWTEIVNADLPPAFDGLKAAAREVGSIQIQNTGTLAGNLCNASPAADGVPPLLTLDATVEISGQGGTRRVPLSEFLTGVRQTVLRPGELVSALLIPDTPPDATSAFLKLGARRYLVISIAMVAAILSRDADGRIADARIAVGACSAVAARLPALEAALNGLRAEDLNAPDLVSPDHLAPLSPIDDVRGTATYRKDAVAELCARAIREAAHG